MWHVANFDPSEVIEFAMKIETKGAELYSRLGRMSENDKSQELLFYLAAEEERHLADFAELGRQFKEVSPRETYPGEYLDYLNSAVETHMFHDLESFEEVLAENKSEIDIIRLAAAFEKDSILFFNSFRRIVNEKNQAVIDKLIKEEEGHLVKLLQLKKQLG